MKLLYSNFDIFDLPEGIWDAVCVTTNGMLKANGCAVMGKGIALEADIKFHISGLLGQYLYENGNHCFDMGLYTYFGKQYHIITFPTKHDWRYKSDINLIRQSCEELTDIANKLKLAKVYLPKPGCGCGGLNWTHDVSPVLSEYLVDDRFFIVM